MCAIPRSQQPIAHEGFVPVKNAELFIREIGQGQPIIVAMVDLILTTHTCFRIWIDWRIRTASFIMTKGAEESHAANYG